MTLEDKINAYCQYRMNGYSILDKAKGLANSIHEKWKKLDRKQKIHFIESFIGVIGGMAISSVILTKLKKELISGLYYARKDIIKEYNEDGITSDPIDSDREERLNNLENLINDCMTHLSEKDRIKLQIDLAEQDLLY